VERVADPLGRDEVRVVARVAHEHPTGAVRLAEVTAHGRSDEAFLAPARAHQLRELGSEVEGGEEVALDVAAIRLELPVGPACDDQRQVVVRRPGCESAIRANPVRKAVMHRHAAPVAVVGGEELRLLVVLDRVDRVGDERVTAVRADEHCGAFRDRGRVVGIRGHEKGVSPERRPVR
jgi:hypothetical protein